MKVACVLGSPRANANSSILAGRFCETAQRRGGEVETHVLNDLQYQGCQGCMICKTKLDRCVLEDDLTPVLNAVREADVVVLASPVYFWDVSAQTKGFLDRTFSYLVPDFITNPVKSRLKPGKKFVLILAQANPDEGSFTNIFPKFDYFFRSFGFTETRFIRACGVGGPGEVESRQDVLSLADRTAEELIGNRLFGEK